ncbi:MAG: hypothetical protein K0R58_4306 [Ramlibacter sp.]|nr:hypothetical protein [Ramlibacter sp.]
MTGRLTNSPVEQYREHLSRGQLGYQADENGRAVFFPRVTAPNGFSGTLKVRIGMRVKVRIYPAEGDEGPYPVFDPVEAA